MKIQASFRLAMNSFCEGLLPLLGKTSRDKAHLGGGLPSAQQMISTLGGPGAQRALPQDLSL